MGSSSPVNTLVKVNEGLLRCKELEIDRQKQQILQLHARIRENELRAQQVLQSHRGRFDELSILHAKESAWRTSGKEPSDEDIRRKLAGAEQEVVRLKEFFQQVTKKYTEDMRRLQEKIKTRDRYISSLKKKCQRESEQNRDKQQRIETLEKYLCDLPTLNDVESQSKQDEVQHKAKVLQRTLCRLQKSLDEGYALIKEKNVQIELQAKREKELITAVLSLQTKVQQCLDDGVRLPMLDLKQLEVEHTELLQQQDHSCRLIESHKEQIERLTAQLKKQQQGVSGLAVHPLPHLEMPKVGRLLKEMSLCLLDLQALCSILSQRAQGKEPSLSLLLGMKSSSVCVEESDCRVELEDGLRLKLLEVSQLRRDIDELRNNIPHPNP